jgi:hypothetical protein
VVVYRRDGRGCRGCARGLPAGVPAPDQCADGLFPLWAYRPNAWKAWRSRDVSGISAGTWGLSLPCAIPFL